MSDKVITEGMTKGETELFKAISRMQQENSIRFNTLEIQIRDSVNGRFNYLESRVDKLEKNQQWVILAVLGAVLAGVLKLVIM